MVPGEEAIYSEALRLAEEEEAVMLLVLWLDEDEDEDDGAGWGEDELPSEGTLDFLLLNLSKKSDMTMHAFRKRIKHICIRRKIWFYSLS